MTISPEALAQPIDWTRIDDALISCAGLLKTLCRDNIGDTAASELEYARSVIAALQAERDAATPKLPDDLAGLVRLLKALATDHECDDEMDAASTCDQAATTIQSLVARNAELEAGIADIADAADSFRDESGDEVAGQIRIRTARLLNKDRQP